MTPSRRTWLLTVTAGGLAGLVAQVPVRLLAQGGGTIPDNDRNDSDDNSINGIIHRLGSVGRVLGNMHSRMDKISAVGAIPPDNSRAEYNAYLFNIIDEANAIIAVADELLAR